MNSQIGFVSESKNDADPNGAVWRTSDGGISWNKVLNIAGIVRDFTFKDSLIGWLASTYISPPTGFTCYKTTDGGKTWNPLNSATFDGTWAIFYNSSTATLLLADGYGHFSTDEGLSWTKMNGIVQMGFSFFNGFEGITASSLNPNCLLFTIDGGVSWASGFGRPNIIDECYQPLTLKNSNKCYALAEQAGVFYSSIDKGHSWIMRYDFQKPDIFTGCIRGDLNRLVIQSLTYDALYSTDGGISWVKFCGPPNIEDTRFCVKSDSVFLGDINGGLWLNTTGIGSNSTPQLSIHELRVLPLSQCQKSDSTITFTFFDSCNGIQAKLISASIQGSNNFSFSSPLAIPRTIHPDDSLIISYNPQSPNPDTAQLHLRFHLGWKDFDTVISLFGAGRIPIEQVQFIPSSANYFANAGSMVDIVYTPNKNISGRGLNSISFDLIYNGDLLDFQGVQNTDPLVTVKAGQRTHIGSIETLSVTITGNNIALDSLQAIATIRFMPMVTKTMQTGITMSNLQLNNGDVNFANCILSADSANTSFTLDAVCSDSTISNYLKGIAPMKIISMRPNPAQDEIEINLQSTMKQDANIEIRNALGACVYSGVKNLKSGPNSIHLDTKGLASGMYLVRVGEVSQSLVISR